MTDPRRVGIVGAGALGLMAAWTLARAGVRVTVFDKEPTPGGLAMGFSVAGGQLERFYHHIFRSDIRMVRLIEELGLGPQLFWKQAPTMVRAAGASYRLDSPQAVLRFPLIPFPDRVRMGLAVGYLKAVSTPERFEAHTASAWIRRWMGERAYNVIWGPQLRGKLGDHGDEVSMPWFWARIHDRSMALGYVRGGFGQVYDRLAAEIRRLGGDLRLGRAVDRIDRDGQGPAIVAGGVAERFDQIIVSAPTSLFMRLANGLPEDYRTRYAAVSPHLGAHCLVIAVDSSEPLQQAYWLSICEPNFPFLAFIEHTNYVPREDFGGLRVCYLGSYIPQDHRYFQMGDEDTLAEMWPAVQQLAPGLSRESVRELHVSKAAYAQPVVTRGYRDRQPPMDTPWPDVWLANMGQVYPHDRGQNYSLLLGEEVAGRALTALGRAGSA